MIVSEDKDLDAIAQCIRNGMPIEALEIKCAQAEAIERMAARVPQPLTVYFEVPVDSSGPAALDVISGLGMRAKVQDGWCGR